MFAFLSFFNIKGHAPRRIVKGLINDSLIFALILFSYTWPGHLIPDCLASLPSNAEQTEKMYILRKMGSNK